MNKSIEPIFKLLQRLNTENTKYKELKELDKTIETLLKCHFIGLRDDKNSSNIDNISSLKDDDLICLSKKGKIWLELFTKKVNTGFVKKENDLTIDNFKDLIDDECSLYNPESMPLNIKSCVDKYFEDLLISYGGKYNSQSNKSVIYQAINCYSRMIQPNIKKVYSLSSVSQSIDIFNDIDQEKIINGLNLIRSYVANNKILSPFLSKSIFNNQDDDHLYTSWNIKHLHINDVFDDDGYIKPSDYLLMCVEKDDTLYFIDIIKHNQKDTWYNKKLIDITNDNKLTGVLLQESSDTSMQHTQKELKTLFNTSSNSIPIDNKIFIMNGVTTSDGSNPSATHQEIQINGKIWKYQYRIDRYSFFHKYNGKLQLKFMKDGTNNYTFALGTSLLYPCLYQDNTPIKFPDKVDLNTLYFD